MSRPKRFGRDRNLVSDGTINDVYIYQYFMHWSMAFTSYLPMLQAGAFIHVHQRFTHEKTCAVFICQYMFSNFFPVILPWDWQIWIKIIPTNVQFIWRYLTWRGAGNHPRDGAPVISLTWPGVEPGIILEMALQLILVLPDVAWSRESSLRWRSS